jgi:hypothetical protein
MPFERGRPPVAATGSGGNGGITLPKVPLASKDPGDTVARESLSRTHISLKAIREELAEFENEIKWRDEKLAELQRELIANRSALEQERTKFRQSEGGVLHDRLRETLDQHAQIVRERDARIQALTMKGRELLGRVQTLTTERGKSAQAMADLVKQVQEQQRRVQSLEEKLAESQQHAEAARTELLRHDPGRGLGGRWQSMHGAARAGIVLGVLVVAAASVAAGASALLNRQERYRVSAEVVLPTDQMDAAGKLLEADPRGRGVQTARRELDVQTARLELWVETQQPESAGHELDELASLLVEKLTPAPVMTGDSGKKQELERRLAELDGQLGGLASQPSGNVLGQDVTLLKAWREQLKDRQDVETQLRKLRPRLSATPPDANSFTVDPALVTTAQEEDSRLQADLQVLTGKQQQLQELLRKSLESGVAALQKMDDETQSASQHVGEASQEVADSEVTAAAAGIVKALGDWQKALSELREAWKGAEHAAAEEKGDALAVHGTLEPAIRGFLQTSEGVRGEIDRQLETIGAGGEEPTKRIVLRNTMSRHLESALSAEHAMRQAAETLLASENPELSGLVQSAAGLATQVRERRETIAAAVRSDALQKAQLAFENDMLQVRAEHEQWLRRAAELDEALLEHNRKVLSLLPQVDQERSAVQRQADLYRERAGVLGQLAALSQEHAKSIAESQQRVRPSVLPARASILPVSPRERIQQAVLLGSLPLMVFMLALAAVYAGVLWSRSRQVESTYQQLLRQ